MDKYEYKVRSEEISNLIDKEKYTEAVNIADTIDWRRVKSAGMLLKIAALYRINRRNEDSREILVLAYERYPTNRSVVYSLCELSIELDDVVAAIEYYKQFAKLAPKDNGVYTLRYRILEAQEASLEERIEILEELKKRDYQEEWAYELAYLYHRVGLSTKCVEECDDIILWFGDGAYVMKAMELKALHVPLTEVQQQKYEIMLDQAENNYGQVDYQNEGYQNEDYQNESYQGEDYQNESYQGEDYQNEVYQGVDYQNEVYQGEDYQNEVYQGEDYQNESYQSEGYQDDNYDARDYNGQDAYGDETYDQGGYAEDNYNVEAYEDGSYANEGYAQNNYVDDGYGNLSYVDNSYQNNGYTGEFYVEQTYDENGNLINISDYESNYDNSNYNDNNYNDANYNNENYDNGNYNNESYDNGNYNNENYSDENYAENGYGYVDSGYDTESSYSNSSYSENQYSEQSYNSTPYVQQNNTVNSSGASDMSQYNTINLQKVVAESMKELFPDDDVFAEDREKYNTKEDISSMGDTRVFSSTVMDRTDISDSGTDYSEKSDEKEDEHADKGAKAKLSDENMFNTKIFDLETSDIDVAEAKISDEKVKVLETEPLEIEMPEQHSQTGKIAQMVTSVSEAAPEPHTGAIKKVLIPGEDARLIKSDSDIDELRDTTEKTVDEEHNRMEDNDENVYREQNIMDMEAELADGDILQGQTTASMNLDDVLVEWERMKLDNAKKHQEEIKKRVLTQTGKIFANFDSSIKNGILDELEREKAEAQKTTFSKESSTAPDGKNASNTTQGYLEPASDDDFDVSYVSDNTAPISTDVMSEPEPEKTETEARGEYLTELERIVAKELGGLTNDIPQEDISKSLYEETVQTDNLSFSMQHNEDELLNTDDLNTETADINYKGNEYIDKNADTEYYEDSSSIEGTEYYAKGEYEEENSNAEYYEEDDYSDEDNTKYYTDDEYAAEADAEIDDLRRKSKQKYGEYKARELDPEDAETIAEMAKEDALRTQEIKMNTADLSLLSEKIVATTKKEAKGAKREEIREFTPDEQALFENFAVTKKIKKQIVFALDNITLAAYTGNIIITGDAGLDTVRLAKNLIKEYQASDANFSGKLAKITGEKFNQRNVKDVFEKLDNGGIIIEKANGMSEEKLYEMALNLNQENLGIVVIMEDTKKEITKLLEKQAMVTDYFNIRIDLMEMDNNALVAYAKNYALALEYSIDELGTLALYTRIANMQSGNHVVTKDEVRDIIDEAIWKSKKSKIKNFVDVLFARRYDNEDMIVLKERDFM